MTKPEAHPTTLFVRNLKPATTKEDLENHFGGVGPLRRTLIVTDHSTGLCKGFGFVHYALAEDAKSALDSLNGSVLHGRRIALYFARPRLRGQSDEDGGLAPVVPTAKDKPEKQSGKLKGSPAMRTVLLTRKDGSQLSEDDAQAAFGDAFKPQNVLLSADGKEARCTFSSWAEAGKAAAHAHGKQFDACIEAMKSGKSARLIVRNLPFKINMDEIREAFARFAPVREIRLEPPRALKGEKEGLPQAPHKGEGDLVHCAGFGFVEYFLLADAKFAMAKLNGSKISGRVVAADLALGKSDYMRKSSTEEEGEAVEGKVNDTTVKRKGSEDENSNGEVHSVRKKDNSAGKEVADEQVEKPQPPMNAPVSTEAEMSRTVFVRNLLFETSASELWKAMSDEFGKVEQAVVVRDRVTGRPRGSAFVRFASESSAAEAVKRGGQGDTSKTRSALAGPASDGLVLQGRHLLVTKAVDRGKARELSDMGSGKAKKDDPRNLRLAWIGQIKPGTKEAQGLTDAELARRVKSDKEKSTKLSRNPNAFVSDLRLSVRNIPKDFEDRFLKQMFLLAAAKGSRLKKANRSDASVATTKEGTTDMSSKEAEVQCKKQPRVTYCKIIRDEERSDRSKGYGFVQFEEHEHALHALHCINNNPKAIDVLIKEAPKFLKLDEHRQRVLRKQWGDGRRLQVDFAVEDRRIVQVLERVKDKGKALAEAYKEKMMKEGNVDFKPGKSKKRKRKDDNETAVDSGKKLSKSEKKSALKRQRAEKSKHEGDSKGGRKGARDSEHVIETRLSSRDASATGKAKDHAETVPASARKRSREEPVNAEMADPKPKKSRRKKKTSDVIKDAKHDSLVDAYKRKLAVGAKKVRSKSDATGSGGDVQSTRWFE